MLRLDLVIFGISFLSGSLSQFLSEDFVKKFQQKDYHVEYERTDVVRYNKMYVKRLELRGFKYNRTSFGINGTWTLNTDFNKDLVIVFQVYKFMSNEYRYFPIRMQIHFCDILDKNLMGYALMAKCGNFTGCPLKKGTYHICNFMHDESRFPPLIPNGRYMAEIHGMHHGTEMFVIDGYSAITRPFSRQ